MPRRAFDDANGHGLPGIGVDVVFSRSPSRPAPRQRRALQNSDAVLRRFQRILCLGTHPSDIPRGRTGRALQQLFHVSRKQPEIGLELVARDALAFNLRHAFARIHTHYLYVLASLTVARSALAGDKRSWTVRVEGRRTPRYRRGERSRRGRARFFFRIQSTKVHPGTRPALCTLAHRQ